MGVSRGRKPSFQNVPLFFRNIYTVTSFHCTIREVTLRRWKQLSSPRDEALTSTYFVDFFLIYVVALKELLHTLHVT